VRSSRQSPSPYSMTSHKSRAWSLSRIRNDYSM
jgi:hypothetical protein